MNVYWRALYTFRDMKLFMSDRLSFLDLVKSVEMSLTYLEKAQMNLMMGESKCKPVCASILF